MQVVPVKIKVQMVRGDKPKECIIEREPPAHSSYMESNRASHHGYVGVEGNEKEKLSRNYAK